MDVRMVNIINKYARPSDSILDVGCGSGLYGPILRSAVTHVYGYDIDPVLCKNAEINNCYDAVYCDDIRNINQHIQRVTTVFCSEVVEHIPNKDLTAIMSKIHSICDRRIIITVPNPLSPHFAHDPTHVLRYTIGALLQRFNDIGEFQYKLYPLGFSSANLRKPYYRLLNTIAKRIPLCSPTVLYIGERIV